MEHGEVGVGAFLPAHEDAPEAVEPGVGALDKPTSCPVAGLTLLRLRLFPAPADVGGEAEPVCELVHLGIVVAFVEAESLRSLPRLGPLDRDRLDRGAGDLEVVQVRARGCDPDRDALPLPEQAPFRPLALSVGFGPVCSPPSGAFPSAPSIASHSHSIPLASS